ncbi:hypothetical protein PR048_027097 [Dryococelus australis]|uniref:Uncharacterized protein n=1 Tax=Dryococelus australis TaxID=614101 RepID=A0ABQ9GER7_9NEOP|nr:hypothetical protein PR048_027097 [Dryococelus australis]
MKQSILHEASVDERLACTPLITANRIESPTGSKPDFRMLVDPIIRNTRLITSEVDAPNPTSVMQLITRQLNVTNFSEFEFLIPEKTLRPAASSSTIPTYVNPGATPPGIEPSTLVGGDYSNHHTTAASRRQEARWRRRKPGQRPAVNDARKEKRGVGVLQWTSRRPCDHRHPPEQGWWGYTGGVRGIRDPGPNDFSLPGAKLTYILTGFVILDALRSDCSPPTKVKRVFPDFSQVGIVPDYAAVRRVFSRISRFLPLLHSGATPFSPHFTFFGFRDLIKGTNKSEATGNVLRPFLWQFHDSRHLWKLISAVTELKLDGRQLSSNLQERIHYSMKNRYNVTAEKTARLACRSDDELSVRVSVARIAPSLLDLGRAIEVLRPDEGRARCVWRGAGMQGRVKREISKKTRRPAASSVTIPTCENPGATPPGFEPGWEKIRIVK